MQGRSQSQWSPLPRLMPSPPSAIYSLGSAPCPRIDVRAEGRGRWRCVITQATVQSSHSPNPYGWKAAGVSWKWPHSCVYTQGCSSLSWKEKNGNSDKLKVANKTAYRLRGSGETSSPKLTSDLCPRGAMIHACAHDDKCPLK